MFQKTIILLAIFLTGCTADWYRMEADRQVKKIVDARKQETLGYTPATPIETTPVAPPTRKTYAKVPFTPIPPETPSVLEPDRFELSFGTLGPSLSAAPPVRTDEGAYPQQVSEQRLARLRLGPPAAQVNVVQLGLIDAFRYASQHSRAFQSRLEDLYLAALDVTLERHLFEPRPFARSRIAFNGGQLDANYQSALNATQSVGVRQQLPYGGEVTAQALVSFIDALNSNTADGEDATLAVTASIPLLRGAGMVNLEPLIRSERQLIYEVRKFEDFRRQFVVDVARAYFRLINAQQSIANRRFKYLSSASLTVRTRALFAAGRLNFLEVQRSLQQQLSDENSLIASQQDYEGLLDDFKILLGMQVDENLDVQAVKLDLTEPPLSSEDLIRLAVQYRLDLQTSRDQIEDARRAVAVANNGLLPDLTLTAGSELGNRTDTPASKIDARNLTYNAGVQLDWPLDRVSERNAYRRSLIQFERAQRSFSQLHDTVLANVRDSVRAVDLAKATLEIQRRAIELAQRRVDYSNELLTQGKVNARDVVESTSSLLNAQDAYNRARADLQIQILQLLRDAGVLRVDPDSGAIGQALDLRNADNTRENGTGSVKPPA